MTAGARGDAADGLAAQRAAEAARCAYPGARAPDRQYRIDSGGIELAVHEWGDAAAAPVLLVHGAFDFARTFDVYAPLVADAGYRIVAYDQRGHGDSDHADLYSWVADERDMLAVAHAVSPEPCPAIGHSKGGSMLAHTIQALPHRFTKFVAIDGLPFRSPHPESAMRERKSMTAEKITEWLDHRQRAVHAARRPGTLEELAQRRARMNPRLSHEWLCYIATHGARRDADGWRWKIDPSMRMGGFGPFRSRWITDRLPGFPVPMLAMFGTVREPMGWDVTAEELAPWLPSTTRVEVFQDTGHFLHIEHPQHAASLTIDFLRS
ncbi:alpha/beta hydrolase [Verticiella sediminum]|uniref:Alpha/beta hydrolase n=1 Tax=Verticiella sediminum TaxID=1247510 RepID=A0A556AGS3_9BURK|nr:alpha/beta hydrolase [Verticiella sediminum]TSH92096.1 alpha/beta hydrolase [Verticiella sediminum]